MNLLKELWSLKMMELNIFLKYWYVWVIAVLITVIIAWYFNR